jgi:hypothetical protein
MITDMCQDKLMPSGCKRNNHVHHTSRDNKNSSRLNVSLAALSYDVNLNLVPRYLVGGRKIHGKMIKYSPKKTGRAGI